MQYPVQFPGSSEPLEKSARKVISVPARHCLPCTAANGFLLNSVAVSRVQKRNMRLWFNEVIWLHRNQSPGRTGWLQQKCLPNLTQLLLKSFYKPVLKHFVKWRLKQRKTVPLCSPWDNNLKCFKFGLHLLHFLYSFLNQNNQLHKKRETMEISQAEKCFKTGFFLNMILKLYVTTKLGLNNLGCKKSNWPMCLAHYSWNACSLQILYCYLTISMWGKPLHILGSTSSLRCSNLLVGKKVILRMGDNIKAQFPFIRLVALSHSCF